MIPGMPAGRAGRTWLSQRLATAERGAELLDGKLRVLQREQREYRSRAEHTASAWARHSADAETWLVRAALLGGQRALRDASPTEEATVDVHWTLVMGVRHPTEAVVTAGRPSADAATPSNSALIQAVSAYRTALDTAAEHAVVAAAMHRLDLEVSATRRRLRAIRDRHLPRLRSALAELELALEELEHADAVRLRWAAAHAAGPAREDS